MKKILITNAIIWAVVLILASLLFKDTENYKYLLGILVVGFTLQNGFTYEALRKNKHK